MTEEGQQVKRFDRNGQPILRHSRHLPAGMSKSKSSKSDETGSPSKKEKDKTKFKVTFIDKIDKETPLTSTTYVLSYKKYNAMNTFDPYEIDGDQNPSHCCTIFWIFNQITIL